MPMTRISAWPRWWICAVAGLPFLTACLGRSAPDSNASETVEIQKAGALTRTRQTHHQFLREELARLEAEGVLPDQLTSGPAWERVEQPTTSEERILVTIPAGGQLVLEKQAERFAPPGDYQWSALSLEQARRFREQYQRHQQSIRAALDDGDLDMRIQFSEGMFATFELVDLLRIGSRYEEIEIGQYLASENPSGALPALRYAFRIAETLANQKHVIPRIEAVHLRKDLLRAVAAIANHFQSRKATLIQLRALLEQQLASWPPDSGAWIGDRACAMHTYELIRCGYFMSLLSEEELAAYENDPALAETVALVQEHIDADQQFYLESMRRVIAACDDPFYIRQTELVAITDDLESLRGGAKPAIVADRFLLQDLIAGHRYQAEDRARVEAWVHALRLALGEEIQAPISPATGQAIHAQRDDAQVIVSGFLQPDAAESIVVRRR